MLYNVNNPYAYRSSPWTLTMFFLNNGTLDIVLINESAYGIDNLIPDIGDSLVIKPGDLKEIHFYLDRVACNASDKFVNITIRYNYNNTNYTFTRLFPFNVSSPLYIANSTIGDTYSIGSYTVGNEKFVIRNNSTRSFSFKIIPDYSERVRLQFNTPKGMFDQNTISELNFTISPEDSVLFGLRIFPILVGNDYVKVDIMPLDNCNENISLNFTTVVITTMSNGLYTSLDENISFILLFIISGLLLVKFIN